MEIRNANLSDLAVLATLFDAYRQFYQQEPDAASAMSFIRERLTREDSVIFLAFGADVPVGFVQLYPSFSSVAMRRLYILNDLYVSPEARKQGVATALINRSEAFAAEAGAVRLALATAFTNTAAQRLYEKLGWKKDELFFHYNKAIWA